MKTLIAYYSWSSNTHRIAKTIQNETGGDLFEIKPVTAYSSNYNETLKQAKKEIQKNVKPALKALPKNIADYDVVFVGTPNWWSTIAPPVASFLTNVDLTGKTVFPFCTHGGGGMASCEKDITRYAYGAKVMEGLAVYGSGNGNEVAEWLNIIKESKV
jgi:flavodoxin